MIVVTQTPWNSDPVLLLNIVIEEEAVGSVAPFGI